MKKFLLILVSLLSLASLGVYAQQKKAAYIYRNDNAFDAFACVNIDSITYETSDKREFQVIWTADSAYSIPLESIDSVCFDTPKNIIFQIPEEDLNGWEIGYSLGDEYVVAYTDEFDGSLVMMVNKSGRGAENALIARFNAHNELVSIGDMDKLYDIAYEGNDMVLYRFNEEGLYEETVLPLPPSQNALKSPRKLPSWNTILTVIEKLYNYIENIRSGITIGTDVMKEDWKDAGIEAGWLLVGIKANLLTGIIMTYTQSAIDHYINQDKERKCAVVYNNCEVAIDEVKPEDGQRVIYATVTNANNLPDYLFRAFYDHEFNEQTRNLVSCGIVVRKGRNNVTTHLNDLKSQLEPLNGDGTAGAEIHLSFTIPDFDDAPNFTTYYMKPYLTSSRLKTSRGDVNEGYIKYGEIYEYKCPILKIDSITKKSGKHYKSSSEYLVEVSVEATIEDVKGVAEWGVAFYTNKDLYNGELLKEVTTSPDHTSFTFNYQGFLDESCFDNETNSIKLIASPFAKGKSNNERAYGKDEEFEINIAYTSCPDDHHPHMIDLGLPSGTLWACCNVGAKNPEDYGDYFAWGETEKKSNYITKNYQYAYEVSEDDGDVKQVGELYWHSGYQDYYWHWHYYKYLNLGSDIAGTRYDVAHVKWGGSWVMPSIDQIRELIDCCTIETIGEEFDEFMNTTHISGCTFTGSNGGTIYFPAAGYYYEGYSYEYSHIGNRGLDFVCWSSTQYTPSIYYPSGTHAYTLSFLDGGGDILDRCNGLTVRPVSK